MLPREALLAEGRPVLTARGGTDGKTIEMAEDGEVTETIHLEEIYPDGELRPIRYADLIAMKGSLTYDEAMEAYNALGLVDLWVEATRPGGLANMMLVGGPLRDGGLPGESMWSFLVTADVGMWVTRAEMAPLKLRREKFGSAVLDEVGVLTIEFAEGPRFYFVPVGHDRPGLRPPLHARASGTTAEIGNQE